MSIIIDEVAALDALRKTVEKYGRDHRVDRCAYTQPEGGWDHYFADLDQEQREASKRATASCCIVGVMLNEVYGVPLEALQRIDSYGGVYSPAHSDSITGSKAREMLVNTGIKIDQDALDVLALAQQVQDNGKTWGYALAKAEAYAETIKNREDDSGTESAGAVA